MSAALRRICVLFLTAACLLLVLPAQCSYASATKDLSKKVRVSLTKTEAFVTKGHTLQLKAKITPSEAKNTKLTWTSSDPSVASVSKRTGLVTAKKYGKAKITATAPNGRKSVCRVTVGTKGPDTLVLDLKYKEYVLLKCETKQMQVKMTPAAKYMKDPGLTYTSSNPKVATVDKNGLVTAVGCGSATITAAASNNKKVSFQVNVISHRYSGYIVQTYSEGMFHHYKRFAARSYGKYYQNYGCVVTAVATIATGFGIDCNPEKIHSAAVTDPIGERYAVKKLGKSDALRGNAAISLATATQIFRDMGIQAKPVYHFTEDEAVKLITDHLNKGKPVLVKASNTTSGGIRIANSHHALSLVAIDKNGKGLFIDTSTGNLNYAHANNTYFSLSVRDFVHRFMYQPTGNYLNAYVTSASAAGGFILVG